MSGGNGVDVTALERLNPSQFVMLTSAINRDEEAECLATYCERTIRIEECSTGCNETEIRRESGTMQGFAHELCRPPSLSLCLSNTYSVNYFACSTTFLSFPEQP